MLAPHNVTELWVEIWWQNWSPSSPWAIRATLLLSPIHCQKYGASLAPKAGCVRLSVFTPAAPVLLYLCEREAPACFSGLRGYLFIHFGNTCVKMSYMAPWALAKREKQRKWWWEKCLEENAWPLISSTWRKWLFHVKCVFLMCLSCTDNDESQHAPPLSLPLPFCRSRARKS